MHALAARAWPFVLAAAVLGGWQATLSAQSGPARRLIAPAPESPGAVARGAVAITAAQKLARAGKYADAITALEKVASAQPAALHDCNLALAYLRGGRLTEAQLTYDVSTLRTVTLPDWCQGDLSRQLASQLRDRHFVALAITVSPPGSVIEVGGVRFRDLPLVWLPQGTYSVVGRSPTGRERTVPVLVAPPAASVNLPLDAPIAEPPPDAGVAVIAPPIDAGVTEDRGEAPIDAPVAIIEAPPIVAPRSRTPAYAAAGVGMVAIGVGAIFHAKALSTKDRADALTTGSTAFADERSTFGTQRAIAIGGYALGAAAIGFATWWWLRGGEVEAGQPTLGISLGDGGATLTFGGAWP